MELPVFQFVSVVSGALTGHHWKELLPILFTPSLQLFIYTDKIPMSLFFFGQSQLSWPSLLRWMLQSLNHFCCTVLDPLQELPVSCVLESSTLDKALQMWLQQCWVETEDHLPWPAGNTSNCSWDIGSWPPLSMQHVFGLCSAWCPYETRGPFLQISFPALKEMISLNIFTKAEKVSFFCGSIYNSTCRSRFLDGNGSKLYSTKKKNCIYSTIVLSNTSEITFVFQTYFKIEMCKMQYK